MIERKQNSTAISYEFRKLTIIVFSTPFSKGEIGPGQGPQETQRRDRQPDAAGEQELDPAHGLPVPDVAV